MGPLSVVLRGRDVSFLSQHLQTPSAMLWTMKTTHCALWCVASLLVTACATSGSKPRSNRPSSVAPAPAPMAMEPANALGLWRSDFGPVKIELDSTSPGGGLMGIWLYERNGREVIGFFAGNLRGNVLDFTWHDPAESQPLTGAGYVVFDPRGTSFTGKLWTEDGTRDYDWNARRVQEAGSAPAPSYGGDTSPRDTTTQPPPYDPAGNRQPPPDRKPDQPRDTSVPGNPYGY